jgi:hypothetical protein
VTLTLEPAPFDDPEVTAFAAASIEEMTALYDGWPGMSSHPRPEEFHAPDGAFFLARLDGRAAG